MPRHVVGLADARRIAQRTGDGACHVRGVNVEMIIDADDGEPDTGDDTVGGGSPDGGVPVVEEVSIYLVSDSEHTIQSNCELWLHDLEQTLPTVWTDIIMSIHEPGPNGNQIFDIDLEIAGLAAWVQGGPSATDPTVLLGEASGKDRRAWRVSLRKPPYGLQCLASQQPGIAVSQDRRAGIAHRQGEVGVAHVGSVELVQVIAADGRTQLEEVAPVTGLPDFGRRAVGQLVDRSVLDIGPVGLAMELAGQPDAAGGGGLQTPIRRPGCTRPARRRRSPGDRGRT